MRSSIVYLRGRSWSSWTRLVCSRCSLICSQTLLSSVPTSKVLSFWFSSISTLRSRASSSLLRFKTSGAASLKKIKRTCFSPSSNARDRFATTRVMGSVLASAAILLKSWAVPSKWRVVWARALLSLLVSQVNTLRRGQVIKTKICLRKKY